MLPVTKYEPDLELKNRAHIGSFEQYKKMYEYLLENNFKINEKDFMIEDLSDNHFYSQWEDIKQKCIDYRHG